MGEKMAYIVDITFKKNKTLYVGYVNVKAGILRSVHRHPFELVPQ